jgi:hypothetical protein
MISRIGIAPDCKSIPLKTTPDLTHGTRTPAPPDLATGVFEPTFAGHALTPPKAQPPDA